MREPFLSIVIPAYNEEAALPGLIREIRDRSQGSVLEIVVADGGSTDRTVQIAENLDVSVLRCKKRGRAAQMNEGAAAAAGTHLYFLHADTLPPPGFDHIIENSISSGFPAGCFRLSFDDPHPLLQGYCWFTKFDLTLFRFGDQSLYVEKMLFQKIGGFDENLVIMEDQQIVRDLTAAAPFNLMKESVVTSARKYRDNGIIRLQLIFTLIVIFYYSGASQELLVDLFNRSIRNDFR